MKMAINVISNCKNLYDSYGEICVCCNACGRFNPETQLEAELHILKRELKKCQEFDNWITGLEELQRKNIAQDIKWLENKIFLTEQYILARENQDDGKKV